MTFPPIRLLLLAFLPMAAWGETGPPLQVDPDTGISLLPGFDAELLYSVPESQGSWVSMAFDPEGRLIVSDQDDKGVFRVTLPERDDPSTPVSVESLEGFPYEPVDWGERKVGGALGFLHAFDSLYMVTMKGLYRIRDTDGDDHYDDFRLLRRLQMGWEHSAHSIIRTEDGEGLYLVSGNYGRIPEGVASRQPPVWDTDMLLPTLPDPMGHAVSIEPPGGWVSRLNPDGSGWTMIASGFRNPVDLAINREGELFTFDSDLEFDIGSPWYRPTRVNHVTSAAEFGWRSGSAKWPSYFADGNGAVVEVGPGSPTGISFGHHSNFPARWQDKLFVCDWTFGTIYTVTLEEDGSSYTGTTDEFLHGTPLNIAAMRFGPDGAMYFVTGGRNTDSKLYRVRHTGEAAEGKVRRPQRNQSQRDLRHELEAWHGDSSGGKAAVDQAWPHLGHDDRAIRYAARLAIENQPLRHWQDRVLSETDPRRLIHGVIALCRHGDPSLTGPVLEQLGKVPFANLGREDRLALLRAYQLCLIRLDQPTTIHAAEVLRTLETLYPAKDPETNNELCRILCHLESPQVVAKTIALMKSTQTEAVAYDKDLLARHKFGKAILQMMSNTPNTRNIFHAYALRRVHTGWTLEHRRYYFRWLNETLEKSGGRSFAGYLRAIRQDAIDQLSDEDRKGLAPLLGEVAAVDLSTLPAPEGPPVAWSVDSAMKLFDPPLRGRDFENGRKMFAAGRCIACHRFAGSGGTSGPDLGSVGSRYSIRDILVAICEPSRSISEQYQASTVTRKDSSVLYGRLIYRTNEEIGIAPNPYDYSQLTRIPAGEVHDIRPSQVSMMPAGTIYGMNRGELMNLVAYLVSGGDPDHEVFGHD